MNWTDEHRAAVARALRQPTHQWRCKYPDQHNGCDCIDQTVSGILAALAAVSAGPEPEWEWGNRRGSVIFSRTDEEDARESAKYSARAVVVRRTAPGPWEDAPDV